MVQPTLVTNSKMLEYTMYIYWRQIESLFHSGRSSTWLELRRILFGDTCWNIICLIEAYTLRKRLFKSVYLYYVAHLVFIDIVLCAHPQARWIVVPFYEEFHGKQVSRRFSADNRILAWQVRHWDFIVSWISTIHSSWIMSINDHRVRNIYPRCARTS